MSLLVQPWEDGALLRLTLNAPKGNVLTGLLLAELRAALDRAHRDEHLRAVVLDAQGKDFSWGASVEEHRPEACAAMLGSLHALVREAVALPLPVLVAVQGKCLGGGLELALAGSRIFAHPLATFGQPEIKLGVFAPAASVLLPERVGAAAAEELLLSGRTVPAGEARALGLIDEVGAHEQTPFEAAVAWARTNLFEHSRTALRYATRAARLERARSLSERVEAVERLYLDQLMRTADAREGIAAFLEHRPPRWTHAVAV